MRIAPMSYITRQNNRNLGRSFQKLSSGKRINSAADNAAGLAIAQKLLKQTNGLDAGVSNAQTSQNMLNVAEGAMSSVSDMLQRVNELSVQAANGTNSGSDRSAIQAEIDQLTQEIDRVSATTKFNETYLLKGGSGKSDSFSTTFHVGAESDPANKLSIDIDAMNAAGIGIKGLNVADKTSMAATNALDAIADALSKVSTQRSSLGAASNRLDHAIAYGNNAVYNMTASHSRIADTDYGKGVTELKKNQLMNTYSIMMQRKYMENQSGRVKQFFNM